MHVHVLCSTPAAVPLHLRHDLRDVLEGRGISVGVSSPDGDLSTAAAAGDRLAERIGEIAARREPPALHALDVVAAAVALQARSSTGVPVIVRSDASPGRQAHLRTSREALVRQACLRAADAVVAPTAHDAHAAAAAGADPARTHVVPDPVVLPHGGAWRRREAGAPSVVALTGAAGAADVVAALRHVPGCRLTLAGESAPEQVDRLRDLAARLGLADRLDWRGLLPREEALGLAARADAVVVAGGPGVRPTTAIEAMALGVPVVALDRPGPADAIVAGATGLLVPAGDPGRLATALRALVGDPFRREAFAEAGLDRYAARYAPDVVAGQLLRIYGIDDAAPAGGERALREAV